MAHIREADNHEAICKACDTTFKNFDNMRHHKRKYHQSPFSEFDCDICGISLKSRDILKAHWDYMHKVESGLNCNLCGRICQYDEIEEAHDVVSYKGSRYSGPGMVTGSGIRFHQVPDIWECKFSRRQYFRFWYQFTCRNR